MAINVNILILPVFGVPFLKGLKMGPRGQKFCCKDLSNIILLFNTFHLRYYTDINVNILLLSDFGGSHF